MNLGEYLYNRLPQIYRVEDSKAEINYTLKRYLQSLDEGGLKLLFDDILNIYDYLDIEKCPNEVLPLLARMLGYNYIEEVDVITQRKIIQNLITLYTKKGTKTVIDFIAREFTGFDINVIETEYYIFKTWSPNPKIPSELKNKEHRTLYKKLTVDTSHLFSSEGKYNWTSVIIETATDKEQIELLNRLLVEFLPIFIKIHIIHKDKDTIIDDTIDFMNNIQIKNTNGGI